MPESLQLISSTLDGLTFRFMGGKKHLIHANITDTYPQSPPVWFSESEDSIVEEALASLADCPRSDYLLLYQVKLLCSELGITIPDQILADGLWAAAVPSTTVETTTNDVMEDNNDESETKVTIPVK